MRYYTLPLMTTRPPLSLQVLLIVAGSVLLLCQAVPALAAVPTRFAYVTEKGAGTIRMFAINPDDGALMALDPPQIAGGGPSAVAVHPCQCVAYVANMFTDNVFVYEIDINTGRLRFPAVADHVAVRYGPNSVAVDPQGEFVYVTASTSNVPGDVDKVWLFKVDPTNGRLTANGWESAHGVGPTSVTVDPTGRFAYVTNRASFSVTMYAINRTTGGLTSLGWRDTGREPSAVTVDPTGRFAYVANFASGDVSGYAINSATGVLTSLGPPVAVGAGPYAITVDPTGRFVYITNDSADTVAQLKIDGTTGQLTRLGPAVQAGHKPTGVAVAGSNVYVVNGGGGSLTGSVSRYHIGATGLLTESGARVPTGNDPEAIAIVDFNPPSAAAIGVFREGSWYLDFNGNDVWDGCGTDLCVAFGSPGDVPVVGDWNGNGVAKIGVFRNGWWYLDLNGNGVWDGCGTDLCVAFGSPGDIPVVGDWIGVFRNGWWYLDLNGNGAWDGCAVDRCVEFGSPGDRPVVSTW
jgi:6-phosphogluconolactonase (cycloisomerase 2 family)